MACRSSRSAHAALMRKVRPCGSPLEYQLSRIANAWLSAITALDSRATSPKTCYQPSAPSHRHYQTWIRRGPHTQPTERPVAAAARAGGHRDTTAYSTLSSNKFSQPLSSIKTNSSPRKNSRFGRSRNCFSCSTISTAARRPSGVCEAARISSTLSQQISAKPSNGAT